MSAEIMPDKTHADEAANASEAAELDATEQSSDDESAAGLMAGEVSEDSLFGTEEPLVTEKSKSISKTIINFWLDGALGVTFLAGLWTAFVTRFVFPPATTAEGWTLWGFTYNQWSDLTFILFCVLGGGIVVHVMLHWSWVCGVITGRLMPKRDGKKRHWNEGEQTLVGVGLIVVILNVLGVAFAYAMLSVQSP